MSIRRSHPRLLALLVALALAITACGAEETATEDSTHDAGAEDTDAGDGGDPDAGGESGDADPQGRGLTVVAPVYPLAWVAEQIAPGAEVELLTGAGGDPHDIELSPRGRELLETADVVLFMGEIGYQPHVERALQTISAEVVSFAEVVGLEALRAWDDDHSRDDDSQDEHAADDDHSQEEHADDDDHGDDHSREGRIDPHAWFDARLMAQVTEAIGDALASVDPGRADHYRADAGELAAEFEDLAAEIAGLLEAGCRHERVIVSHEAYAYLVEPFGLAQDGVSGVGGHGPASPQRIAELVRTARQEGIEHVLAEPAEGREDAAAVADEAQIELLDIYSLEVIDDEGLFEEHGFLGLLREQARTAAIAMDCG